MPAPPHRVQTAALGLLCLAGLGLAASPAPGEEPRTPGPGEVIGYAEADRSGGSQAWSLPADQPYLYVPALPDHMGGRLAAVETGPEVGVALFQGPYFTSRDRGCQPVLGTGARPDLRWLGATARFAPAPPGQPDPAAAEAPGAAGAPAGTFGSMIIYRSVLGPPPGALLLERRPTLGVRCANPVLGILYNRLFVPMAEAPAKARCFDLAENYPAPVEPFALDFLQSDRMVLLMPGDMSARYEPIRHNITVSLFEGLSCRGASMSVSSDVAAHRDLRLIEAKFRARARSIRVSYVDGNAEAFLVRREPPPVAAAPPTPAPEPPVAPQLVRPSDPPVESAAETPAPAPDPKPVLARPAVEPPAVEPSAVEPPTDPAPAREGETPAEIEETRQEAVAATPAPAREEAASDLAPEAPAAQPIAAPSPEVSAEAMAEADAGAAPAPKVKPQTAARPAKIAPPAPQASQAPPAPAVQPLGEVLGEYKTATLSPGAASAPLEARTFAYPMQNLYRLNHCLNWQRDCGQAAAVAWCKAQGFAQAVDWRVEEDIGAYFPTFVLGEKKVCALATCDGFEEITCAR